MCSRMTTTDEQHRMVGKARGEYEVRTRLARRILALRESVDRTASTSYVGRLERAKATALLEILESLWRSRYGGDPARGSDLPS